MKHTYIVITDGLYVTDLYEGTDKEEALRIAREWDEGYGKYFVRVFEDETELLDW